MGKLNDLSGMTVNDIYIENIPTLAEDLSRHDDLSWRPFRPGAILSHPLEQPSLEERTGKPVCPPPAFGAVASQIASQSSCTSPATESACLIGSRTVSGPTLRFLLRNRSRMNVSKADASIGPAVNVTADASFSSRKWHA